MLRIELEIGELDIDRLAEAYWPLLREKLAADERFSRRLLGRVVPSGLTLSLLRRLPRQRKERLLAEQIDKNLETLLPLIEEWGADQQVCGRIRQAAVSAYPDKE